MVKAARMPLAVAPLLRPYGAGSSRTCSKVLGLSCWL
jgi:hypothetical protein